MKLYSVKDVISVKIEVKATFLVHPTKYSTKIIPFNINFTEIIDSNKKFFVEKFSNSTLSSATSNLM